MDTRVHSDLISAWLKRVVPEVIDKGGDEKDLLLLCELLLVGTIVIVRDVYKGDPHRALALVTKQAEDRLAQYYETGETGGIVIPH